MLDFWMNIDILNVPKPPNRVKRRITNPTRCQGHDEMRHNWNRVGGWARLHTKTHGILRTRQKKSASHTVCAPWTLLEGMMALNLTGLSP